MQNNKSILLTHNDLDGIGIICLAKYFQLPWHIEIVDYKDYERSSFPYDKLKKYKNIYVFDFYINKILQEQIENQKDQIVIVGDHHKSQYEIMLNWKYDKFTYLYDIRKSGTELFMNFLEQTMKYDIRNSIKEFVNLVSTYDLYDYEQSNWLKADGLNKLFYKLCIYWKYDYEKYRNFIEYMIKKFEQPTFDFIPLDLLKIQEARKKEDEIFQDIKKGKILLKTRKDSKENYFVVIKLSSRISNISLRLLQTYKKLSYIVIINDYDENELKLSLRSKKGFNLLTYIKNAVGHEEAGSIENLDKSFFEDLWNGKIYELTLI